MKQKCVYLRIKYIDDIMKEKNRKRSVKILI